MHAIVILHLQRMLNCSNGLLSLHSGQMLLHRWINGASVGNGSEVDTGWRIGREERLQRIFCHVIYCFAPEYTQLW
jgi:hypothetical protein